VGGRRDEIILATKFGCVSHVDGADGVYKINSRPDNVRTSLEGSLQRLGTDHLDFYYQHRVDPEVAIEEVVGVVGEMVAEGKVRNIGLSEAGVDTIRRAHQTHPITVLQSEYSLWSREPEDEVLPLLRELGIGFVAYSPLGRGFLTGAFREQGTIASSDFRAVDPRFGEGNFEQNLRIVDVVEALAAELDATPAQVALAWLLAQGDDIVPIPGRNASPESKRTQQPRSSS